jgi:hypothetical protein
VYKDHEKTAPAPEKEKNQHQGKHKVAGHAAVHAAAGKKDQGEEYVADYDNGNPDTRSVEIEFITKIESNGGYYHHPQYRQHRNGGNPFNYPGNNCGKFREYAEGKDQIEDPALQGQIIGKNIFRNEIFNRSQHVIMVTQNTQIAQRYL